MFIFSIYFGISEGLHFFLVALLYNTLSSYLLKCILNQFNVIFQVHSEEITVYFKNNYHVIYTILYYYNPLSEIFYIIFYYE